MIGKIDPQVISLHGCGVNINCSQTLVGSNLAKRDTIIDQSTHDDVYNIHIDNAIDRRAHQRLRDGHRCKPAFDQSTALVTSALRIFETEIGAETDRIPSCVAIWPIDARTRWRVFLRNSPIAARCPIDEKTHWPNQTSEFFRNRSLCARS